MPNSDIFIIDGRVYHTDEHSRFYTIVTRGGRITFQTEATQCYSDALIKYHELSIAQDEIKSLVYNQAILCESGPQTVTSIFRYG